LTLGSFKATHRFFARQFHDRDAIYVARQLGGLPGMFALRAYEDTTARRHRPIILEHLGFQAFEEPAKHHLLTEIHSLIRSPARPKAIFLHALDIRARRKTAIPSASLLPELIVREMRRHKGTLTEAIAAQVPAESRALLEALLAKPEEGPEPPPPVQRFKLTLLKTIAQSTQPATIAATLDDWHTLQLLHTAFSPIMAALDLPPDGLRYYANAVLKSQVFQVARRVDEDRHLPLLCFIAHPFYRLQATPVDILLTVVQTALNAGQRQHKEPYDAARKGQRQAARAFVECVDQGALSPLQAIEAIACRPALSDPAKVQRLQDVLTAGSPQRGAVQAPRLSCKAQVLGADDDGVYYEGLAARSRKLHNRGAKLVMVLALQGDETSALLTALGHYQAHAGQVLPTAPVDFLTPAEQHAVLDAAGVLRVPLSKALLCIKIAEALQGGVLNLRHSYKYRSLDDYLIAKQAWDTHRAASLQRAELPPVAAWPPPLDALALQLDQQYQQTNRRIRAGDHPHVHFRKDGSFHVSTPQAEPEDSEPLRRIFPKRRYVSLLEVLATVNRFAHFLEAFVPWRGTHTRSKPPDRTFFAGITGYGCFIGTRKIASISSGLSEAELESTINGDFTLDNLHGANDRIVPCMEHWALPHVYRHADGLVHTSSDGQKFEVAVDSRHARYAFKYFGQDQGVSASTFIAMRHFLPYSLIMSAAEHEAHEVIDGLMHNEVVKSASHSTDTSGYSEILFGAMHLLGFAFAPRIKHFATGQLYAFQKRKRYEQQGDKMLPAASSKPELLADQWDEILRCLATINRKEATASQLFKRLNSSSRQPPLYHARKEFGKIPKSDFLLRYTDILALRQAVEKQLNKGESMKKLARAVSFGNTQEFLYGEKVEQESAAGCQRLMKNAIICWNYLYLTHKIADADSEERRQELLLAVRHGSVGTWHPINLHGESDFSDEKLQDSIGLHASTILAENVLGQWEDGVLLAR